MKKKPVVRKKSITTSSLFQTGDYTSRLSDRPQSGFHESFRTSDTFFQQIVDSLEEYAVFTTDTAGYISSWNSGATRILGYQEKEIIGKNSAILFTPEDRKKGEPEKELKTAERNGKANDMRWHVRRGNKLFWASGRVFPLYDSEGNLRGFTKIMRDLTDRKKNEETEKRFQSIIENSSDGVRMIDEKGNIIYASPSTERILGYTRDEYINQKILTLIHPDDRKQYKAVMKKGLSNPRKRIYLTYRIKHKNGEYRWMEGVGVNLLSDPAVRAVVSNFRDITDRKAAEDEKERVLNQFKAVLKQLPAGVIIAEAKTGKFTLVNDQVPTILRTKDVFANSYKDYNNYPRFHPDGSKYTPREWPLARAMRTGEVTSNEEIKILRGDGTFGYILTSGAPITNSEGKIIAGVSTFIDITEMKQIETRKDEFVSLASHELKTPTTSLNLFADLLKKQVKDGKYDKADESATKIKNQTRKLTELVNDLLDVSRIETGKLKFQFEQFNVHELLQDIIEDMQYTTPKHTFICKAHKELVVQADKYRIFQVLTNLLTNAIKYSPEGRSIIISAVKKNDFIQVSVSDQGIGIDKHQHEKIFEKLYQVSEAKTKAFPGLGMGLFISKGIITSHGGTMWVESKGKNKGSTFHFTLPIKRID